jgi:5-methylcytosine-specific restriction protein A
MAWHHQGSRHARGYGSAWVRLREIALRRDSYLCQPCLAKGRPTPATEVDHIVPKAKGGTDDLENTQSICKACHAAKTAQETAEAQQALRDEGKIRIGADGWPIEPERFGYTIPHGMRPAACRVNVIFGPPGSGKTTHVHAHAARKDRVIDLEEINVRLGGKPWDSDPQIIRQSLRWRDMAIRALADAPPGFVAWLIVTGETPDERRAWLRALGPNASATVMDTPPDECIRRIRADERRAHASEAMVAAVERWTPDP